MLRFLLSASFFALSSAFVAVQDVAAQGDALFIEVTNYQRLGGDAPLDPEELAESLLKDLGEDDLASDASFIPFDHEVGPPDASVVLMALLRLASPTDINRTARVNGRFVISPAPDFDAFCDAIDFGRIVSKNRRQNLIRLRVDPSALDPDTVRSRIEEAGLGRFFSWEEDSDGPRLRHIGTTPTNIAASPINPDGFSIGDEVECQYNDLWVAGEVAGETSFDKPVVRFDSPADFIPALNSKRLAKTLRSTPVVFLTADPSRIRPASAGGSPVQTRMWSDATGRFTVQASLIRIDGDAAVLKRQDGRSLRVPISKLSEQDQAFIRSGGVAEPENPFKTTEPPKPVVANPTVLEPKVRQVRRMARATKWDFTPTPYSPRPALGSAETVSLPPLPGSELFFEEVRGPFHSLSGERLALLRKLGAVGGKDQWMLDCMSPTEAAHKALIKLPTTMVAEDVDLDRGLVLLRPDSFSSGVDEGKLYVERMARETVKPIVCWTPYSKGAFGKRASDVKYAFFLDGNQVLTVGDSSSPLVVWDMKSATALLATTNSQSGSGHLTPALDARRQLVAYQSKQGISVVDLKAGRHLGDLELPKERKSSVQTLAIRDDQQALAATTSGALLVWDLRTGKLIRNLWRPELGACETATWVGDLLLVDGAYLYDPDRRILLWEFVSGSLFRDGVASVSNGRLWFSPGGKSRDKGGSYVASFPLPNPAIEETLSQVGTADDLLICRKGDEVELAVDIAPELEDAESVRPKMEQQLKAAGLKVVEKAPVVFIAYCRALPAQKVYIQQDPGYVPQWISADEYDRMPNIARRNIQSRSMVLYDSKIAMLHNGRELFAWGGVTRPIGNIYAEEGESLDQALKRLTTPNLERFKTFPFVAEAALQGDATDNGAYGFSTINGLGVVENATEIAE